MIYKYYKLSENEIKLIKETKVSGYNDIKPINENDPKIIKDGRKQYYLINDKLYKVKKDKSQGELFGSYNDGKIIEGKKSKSKNNEILTVSKINIISDNFILEEEPEKKVKKIIKKKVKTNSDMPHKSEHLKI